MLLNKGRGKVQPDLNPTPASPAGAISAGLIISALPNLTKQELRAVLTAIDKELIKGVEIDTELVRLVYEAAGEKPIAISKFIKMGNGILWRMHEHNFHGLVAEIVGEEALSKIEMLALRKQLVQVLIDDIRMLPHIQLNMRTICTQLKYIRSAFDRAYPGYLRNGLGHIIVKKIKHDNPSSD